MLTNSINRCSCKLELNQSHVEQVKLHVGLSLRLYSLALGKEKKIKIIIILSSLDENHLRILAKTFGTQAGTELRNTC